MLVRQLDLQKFGRGCGAAGIEPASEDSQPAADSKQNCANSAQSSALAKSAPPVGQRNPALTEQNPSTSAHEKCVPSVYGNPEIAEVAAAWDDLPDLVKAKILKLVRA
jgi:hypothetical protein